MTDMTFKIDATNIQTIYSVLSQFPLDGSMQITFSKPEAKTRTLTQNRCAHDYVTALAKEMADGGLDMRQVIKVPVTPTHDNVWADMWLPVLNGLYKPKTSTTELLTVEMQGLYEEMNRFTGERWGISLHWPSRDTGGRT